MLELLNAKRDAFSKFMNTYCKIQNNLFFEAFFGFKGIVCG